MSQSPSVYTIVTGQYCGHHWFREESDQCPVCLARFDNQKYAELMAARNHHEDVARNLRSLLATAQQERDNARSRIADLENLGKQNEDWRGQVTRLEHLAARYLDERDAALKAKDIWKGRFEAVENGVKEALSDQKSVIRLNLSDQKSVIRLNLNDGSVVHLVIVDDRLVEGR